MRSSSFLSRLQNQRLREELSRERQPIAEEGQYTYGDPYQELTSVSEYSVRHTEAGHLSCPLGRTHCLTEAGFAFASWG